VDLAAELGTVINVGFAGGEVFLPSVYPCMLAAARHVHDRYGTWLSVSTNAFWATDRPAAREKLKPLVDLGLRSMLVSCDDFHAQAVPLSRVATCLESAAELDVLCTVQTITLRGSRRSADFRELLKDSAAAETRWVDNDCAPVGRAAREIPPDRLDLTEGIPMGHCTVLRVLNVDPDWTVRPCCGSGLVADRLAVGNLRSQGFVEIDRRTRVDPVMNMLSLWGGPLGLARQLEALGRPEFLRRTYTCACHACHVILSDRRAMALLEPFLKDNRERLMAQMAWAEQECGLNHRLIVQERADAGGISQLPGGRSPESVSEMVSSAEGSDA
jgi:hypothetical protein